jgi:hypothetical protein
MHQLNAHNFCIYTCGQLSLHLHGVCLTLQTELVGKNINVIVPPPFSRQALV